jgi:Mn-dependent DtxR family transcriptional regulator
MPSENMKRYYMDYEESKQLILDSLTKKLKSKSKFYFSDLTKILGVKPREAKKIVNQMVTEGALEYWSSGSTSMYGMPGTGKQAAAEHEEKEE